MRSPQFVPPRLPMRFFRAICKADFLEEIEGDLLEIYEQKALENSPKNLKWLFIWEIALLIRPKLLKSFIPSSVNPFFMIQDHLKVSFRNLRKYRAYTLINLLGLSLGIAASVLLFLVVRFERSFDNFHANSAQLYVVGESEAGGKPYFQSKVPLAPKLKEGLPEVVLSTRYGGWDSPWLETNNGRVHEVIKLVDPDFALMFDFKVKEGDFQQTLSTKDQLAITETVAKKLFGFEPAVGRQVQESQSKKTWLVGAVLEDLPSNSSMQFDVLTGWDNRPEWLRDPEMANWYNTFMPAFAMLESGVTPEKIDDKLAKIVADNFANKQQDIAIALLPLAAYRTVDTDNASIVNLLAIVAVIIVSIASVNFINMATAQALVRIREVTIRKVLGSNRRQLISQFIIESLMVNFLAAALAWLVVYLMLPGLEERFSIELQLTTLDYFNLIGVSLMFVFCVGLLSGLFPSFYATSIKPKEGLNGAGSVGKSGDVVRKSLLVFQFAASIFMMAGTLVVWKQIQFMKEQDLNFADGQLLAISVNSENFSDSEKVLKRIKLWQDDYKAVPGVGSVSFGYNVPGRYWDNYNRLTDKDDTQNGLHMKQAYVADNYFETLGVKFVEGRSFDRILASDSNAAVINKKAMEALGWESIEGKYLCDGGEAGCTLVKVVGVTEDFHYQSLKNDIEPLMHYPIQDFFNFVVIRFEPGKTQEVLARVEADWRELQSYEGLDYFFVDQEFAAMYAEQERIGFSAALFSILALIIASLGLFSVASFMIRRKRKEISIRKVMGASLSELAVSLTKGYLLLVAIAFVIAIPASYYLMDNFLQGFAYHIALDPAIFVAAGGLVLLFALISVGLIVLRAAKENPVLALRDE